jgi:hypothetical protein
LAGSNGEPEARDDLRGSSGADLGTDKNWTNLANPVWPSVSTNTLTGGLSYFIDPQWTNHPRRFYRLYSP